MRITDWAINNFDKKIVVIVNNDRVINNYFIEFNRAFINKNITIKAECLWSKTTTRLPNNTYIYIIKENVADTFFRGRKVSAVFYEDGVDNDTLALAITSLENSDYNEVLFKEFIPYN